MCLNIYTPDAIKYKSNSQKIRVMSEYWVARYAYCPSCGNTINSYANNQPVADFYCPKCIEDFELKSKGGKLGKKIADGAYSTMIKRLVSSNNPNFFFLNYDRDTLDILNFLVIPKHFFILDHIEKRKPLSSSAKRAGWVGCNIVIESIPESGKIYYIKDRKRISKNIVLESWRRTIFLRESMDLDSKGWLLDIIYCIEILEKESFSLSDIYSFEPYLKSKHLNNHNIKAKIRQQLQILRDKGYIEFISRGRYKIVTIR